MSRKARRSSASWLRWIASSESGKAMAARVATIAAVISTSMSVKPCCTLATDRKPQRRRQLCRHDQARCIRKGHRLEAHDRRRRGRTGHLEDEPREFASSNEIGLAGKAQLEPAKALGRLRAHGCFVVRGRHQRAGLDYASTGIVCVHAPERGLIDTNSRDTSDKLDVRGRAQ